jgi:uncharacterized membrane protein (UPF0127 family)
VPTNKQRRYRFINATKSTTLAANGRIVGSWFGRLRGLLFTSEIAAGDGLLLKPCSSIHMLGMTYAIDCVFLDGKGKVVGLVRRIPPWHMSALYWRAQACLELPAGTIDDTDTETGDEIRWTEVIS